MMKPADTSISATDDYMTLLPPFTGRGNMANMYKGFQVGWCMLFFREGGSALHPTAHLQPSTDPASEHDPPPPPHPRTTSLTRASP
jgi:hypothetical protein